MSKTVKFINPYIEKYEQIKEKGREKYIAIVSKFTVERMIKILTYDLQFANLETFEDADVEKVHAFLKEKISEFHPDLQQLIDYQIV